MKSILKNRRALSGVAAAVIIVAMLLAAGFAGFGFYTNWTFQLSSTGGGGGGGDEYPTGTYTIQCFAYDSLLTTTTRVIATDVSILYYTQIGGVWQQLGSAPAAATGFSTVALTGNELGYIYAVVTTSSAFYLDVAKSVQMNSLMTYVGYENVLSGAAMPQYVFKINMNGITPGLRATADVILNFYAITYAAFTFATVPANITGVGVALNTTYLGWSMISPTVNTGMFIRQITLTTNDTSSATQTFYKQNIPGVGFLNGGTFTVNPQASAIVYTWTAPTNAMTGAVDLGSCIPWTYGSGTSNKFDLQTGIQSTLAAAATENWVITVYWLTPASAGGSASQYMCYHATT